MEGDRTIGYYGINKTISGYKHTKPKLTIELYICEGFEERYIIQLLAAVSKCADNSIYTT